MGSIDRRKGTVKWFNSRRGYGFITPEESEGDLFVHKTSIKGEGVRSLTAGETVEFVISVGNDGRSSAISVTGLDGVFIRGRRSYACYLCNVVGHKARDCKRHASFRRLGPCYNCAQMGHLVRDCPFILFPNPLNPSELGSLSSISPHPAMVSGLSLDTILFDEYIDSEEEEQIDESDEDEPQRGEKARDWAELPYDILMLIFKKIAAAEILRSAQFVCKSWRQLSYVPALWRCIDMRMYDFLDGMESLAIKAVDRSEGCLEELYVEYFPTEELMWHITERATLLRRLHLISVCLNENVLVETVRKFSLLEELEISHCSFLEEEVEQVAQACPQLKSFCFNERLCKLAYSDLDSLSGRNVDMVAMAIAKHMKQLRRLQLFGNGLTSTGLLAILDNCSHLEHLDIRQCLNVDLDENLKKKCSRIKVLRLPNDSTADYKFREDDDADFDPSFTYSDCEFGYDNCFYHGHVDGYLSDEL